MDQPTNKALDALGDATRRRILQVLSNGPQSVREIAEAMPVTRPAVSHHLKVLKAADLVAVEADGTRRIYRVEEVGLEQLRAFIDDVWGEALSRLKLVAENLGPASTREPGGRHGEGR